MRIHTHAIAIAALGLALAGCGGGDMHTNDTADTAAVDAKPAAAEPAARRTVTVARHRSGVIALAVASESGLAAIAASDGAIRLVDTASGDLKRTLATPAVATGLAFVSQGKRLVAIERDSGVEVFDVAGGKRLARLNGHEQPPRAIAASLDGRVVATGGEESRVLLWDGEAGRLRRALSGSLDFVNAVAVSPDGRLVAAGNAAGVVLVWETASGKLLATLRGHRDAVDALAFHPSGQVLASAGRDRQVTLWQLADGNRPRTLPAGDSAARSLAFSADGGRLAAGTDDGAVRLFDTTSAQLVRSVAADATSINVIAFSGRTASSLLAGTEGGRLVALDDAGGRSVVANYATHAAATDAARLVAAATPAP